ncbi:prepilin-type N-terminal cleavage/methylation domain-containing protein [Acidaminobacter sp. JC074]|uniref:PulJ/GspJ family protein n=1 Tax=Acidaminobacter sp. JC074 TaxID=2530199 RepID=UPI001F0CDEE3|nr:prepilin-type N-terminal cleavage/methylation domain-containing protein [Acidaminobacter sp. JC074]MCH4888557.1 prepilin-type N-terminal cleavage/methylation domain-containing protein [Acidaminobacter sp. JC074]
MNKDGFTLIEVIVSIALLSIVVLGGISVLTNSYVTTILIGDSNTTFYQAESAAETLFNGGSVTDSVEIEDSIFIVFPDKTIQIEGRSIEIRIPSVELHGKNTSNIRIFIPD